MSQQIEEEVTRRAAVYREVMQSADDEEERKVMTNLDYNVFTRVYPSSLPIMAQADNPFRVLHEHGSFLFLILVSVGAFALIILSGNFSKAEYFSSNSNSNPNPNSYPHTSPVSSTYTIAHIRVVRCPNLLLY